MVHPIPNCWRGDCNYGARWPLWGNLGVTIIQHDIADSNTWPVNTVWWIACACRHTHKCACRFGVRARCMCACVRPPGEPLWPDGVSDGTLITQPSKGGCPGQKWVEGWWLCGGWRCCLRGEGVEVRGTCGGLHACQVITQTCNRSHRWAIRWNTQSEAHCVTSSMLYSYITGAPSKKWHHFKPVILLKEQIKKKQSIILSIINNMKWKQVLLLVTSLM